MNLTLYKTQDAQNVIGKTLTDSENLTINLKRDTDVVNPVLMLAPVVGLDYFEFNYCEITELGRKYFIVDVETVGPLFRLSLRCDVLETYKTAILASSGKISAVISSGDYGQVAPEFTGDVSVSDYVSDVELVPVDNSILSVLRWS